MIREIFESTVERAEGYTLAASFPTAIQALRYVEKNDVDLVLMDVLIPGSMSGLGVAEKIKAVKPDVKIIVVTSMPELSYEKRAREIGVEGFWQKEIRKIPPTASSTSPPTSLSSRGTSPGGRSCRACCRWRRWRRQARFWRAPSAESSASS